MKAWNFTKNKLIGNFPNKYSSERHPTDTFDSGINDRLMQRLCIGID